MSMLTTQDRNVTTTRRVSVGAAANFPENAGIAVLVDGMQIAVYNFAARGEWYACANRCPHTGYNVLARGLIGDAGGEPKVACPMHKKAFSLRSGGCLSAPEYEIPVYGVEVEGGEVFLLVPD